MVKETVFEDFRRDSFGFVGGDREGYAVTLCRGYPGYDYADYLAVGVKKRPSRIAGINRGIKLNQVWYRCSVYLNEPVNLADNATGQGIPQFFQAISIYRLADSNNSIADVQLAGIGKKRG